MTEKLPEQFEEWALDILGGTNFLTWDDERSCYVQLFWQINGECRKLEDHELTGLMVQFLWGKSFVLNDGGRRAGRNSITPLEYYARAVKAVCNG